MLPAGTVAKLEASHPEGTRHQTKLELAMEMLGNGVSRTTVEATLSANFPDASPQEIAGVINWALAHDPQPSAGGGIPVDLRHGFLKRRVSAPVSKPRPSAAMRALEEWLNGRLISEADIYAASPVKPHTDDFTRNAWLLMECLYSEGDCLNIVCANTISDKGKAHPQGPGKILPSIGWCRWFEKNGIPQTKAGAWMRPNPVKESGSGAGGAVMDSDVTSPRFLLLESDCLPFDLQLTAIASFRLPVAAVLTSGGASYHAWVQLDASDLTEYGQAAGRILSAVSRFGFDSANKNVSRLSRLPGATRQVKSQGDGRQRLVYLNPNPKWRPIL